MCLIGCLEQGDKREEEVERVGGVKEGADRTETEGG